MRTIFLLKKKLFLRDRVYWNSDSGDVIEKGTHPFNVNNIYHIHTCNHQDCNSIQMTNVWDFGGVSRIHFFILPRKCNWISYFVIKGLELNECLHNLVNLNQINGKKVTEAILFHIASIQYTGLSNIRKFLLKRRYPHCWGRVARPSRVRKWIRYIQRDVEGK